MEISDNYTPIFKLTEVHKEILEERRRRHLTGESASYTWEQVVERIKSTK